MTISATKPAAGIVPTWATTGGTRAEPSSGQKASGWTSGQRPTYSAMNWLQGVGCDWLQYAEDATDQLQATKLENTTDTFTGTLTVTGSVAVSVDLLLGASGRVDSSLLPKTNNTRSLGSTALRWVKVWGADADFSGDVDVGGNIAATACQVSGVIEAGAGIIGLIDLDEGLSPAPTSSQKNQVTAANTTKAWASIAVDAAGSPSIEDGFNFDFAGSSISAVASLQFGQNFSNAFFHADVSYIAGAGAPPLVAKVSARSAGGIGVELRDFAGASVNANAVGFPYTLTFSAVGRQV